MKYLIAGLGNIGEEYAGTRHNVGFEVADLLVNTSANASEHPFDAARYSHAAKMKFRGKTLVLIKPTTYMNLSGNAVDYWMKKENIPLENLLVITDDIALPFGSLRLRSKGSDGGHNGLKHIQEVIGSNEFARLRFGIGNEFGKGRQVNYVLGKWTEDEKKTLREKLDEAAEIVKSFVQAGVQLTMTKYNKKS